MQNLFEKVRDLCSDKQIGIRGLEKELGFGDGTIYKWKSCDPAASKLKAVADYFGCTVDELLREEA